MGISHHIYKRKIIFLQLALLRNLLRLHHSTKKTSLLTAMFFQLLYPDAPWDWNINLHLLNIKSMVNVGKYSIHGASGICCYISIRQDKVNILPQNDGDPQLVP